MSNTPETDAAVIASNGQWSFVLKETCQRLERERDDARKHLEQIKEYGTEEINAAVELRQKLAKAFIERDKAREDLEFRRELYMVQENYLEQARKERDKAREDATNYYARIGELERERDEAIFVMRETRHRLDDAWLEIERLKLK